MFLKLKISATFALHLFNVSYKWIFRDVAQAGSAPGWGSGGRKFESCRPDKEGFYQYCKLVKLNFYGLFCFLVHYNNIKFYQFFIANSVTIGFNNLGNRMTK